MKNKEYYRNYEREHYNKDLEWREKRRTQTRNRVIKWRKKVIDKLGGCCTICGYSDVRALQIDHINGGGRIDRNGKVTAFYKKVLMDNKGIYQLLCANCNAIKRIENNEF